MMCKKDEFSPLERIWMQVSFHGIWILGVIAMLPASPPLAIGYFLAFPVLGVVYGIMRLWVCPGCPYLIQRDSCLQAPPSISRWVIRKSVAGPLNLGEKIGFFAALYGVGLAPAYWVVQTRALLAPYLVLNLAHYSGYILYFCRRCLHVRCPHNMAGPGGHG
jgi:hypothetical protein